VTRLATPPAPSAPAGSGDSLAIQGERTLVLLLTVAWWLAVAYQEYRRPVHGVDLRSVSRLIGMLVAGPIAIRFLFAEERNKLVSIIILTLALGGSSLGTIRGVALNARWVFLGLAAVVGVDHLLRRGRGGWSFPNLVVLLWGVLAMVSSTYAIRDPEFAFDKSISVFLLGAACLLYVQGRFLSPADLESAAETLGKLTAAFIAVNFVLLFSSIGYLGGRYRGITENPNTLGGFFTINMAPMLFLFFRTLEQHRGLRHPRVLLYGCFTVGSLGLLLLSGSRAGVLGAFVASAIYLFVAQRRYFVLAMASLVPVVATLLLLMPAGPVEVPEEHGPEVDLAIQLQERLLQADASGRFEAWDLAFEKIRERPLLGTGWGTTRFIFGEYQARHYFLRHTGTHVHNSYLELAMELGVPLAALFVVMLLYVVTRGTRVIRQLHAHRDRAVMGALLGAMVGGMTGAFWESWLIAAGSFGAFQFWFVTALVAQAYQFDRDVWRSP
jgi:O-antigen ligase